MMDLTTLDNTEMTEAVIRDKIAILEAALNDMVKSGAILEELPLKHTFTDGIYIREITIPAGIVLVGKIHKHAHLNYITSGKVTVLTKDGLQTLEGPCSMISSAGTKRALYTHTETIWTTVHANPTEERDLIKLEEITIAPDYSKFPLVENKASLVLGESV